MKLIEAVVLNDQIVFYEYDSKDKSHRVWIETKHVNKLEINVTVFLKSGREA